MSLSAAHYAAMHALADATPRDSARDGGFSLLDTERLQGRCFDCGHVAALEYCHVVPSSGRVTSDGVAMGGMGCRRCNLVHLEIVRMLGTDGALPYAYAIRLDVMPMESVNRAMCVKAYKDSRTSDYATEAKRRLISINLI